MTSYPYVSSGLTLLVLLTATSLPHLYATNLLSTPRVVNSSQKDALLWQAVSRNKEKRNEERQSIHKDEAEELFKDVDPKTLAAVLLEALNHSKGGRKEAEKYNGLEEERKAERREDRKEETYMEVRSTKEGRGRDGRQELELLMVQQRQEEEERQKAQEEEEKMIEKVISHTTSHTIQNQTEQQTAASDEREAVASQQGLTSPTQGSNEEEEEQLSVEELKSLENMMRGFPRLNIATKREGDSEHNQRISRGYNSYNDIIPINKGSDLAMSTKKLKWQEETQKALNFPTFKGGNYMDEFKDSNYDTNVAEPQLPAEQEVMKDDEPMGAEEDEEVLTSEEEEAQAKAEQEEIRRQAAEAQRAKMEEEKLADIASDMLLRYMVKQNNGNKKHSSTPYNAAEDKRSDEELNVTEDEDIDPQTIDKLIEISSKLHLPADDVVDIISDVEKKKKKDVPPEPHWRQPALSSSFSSGQIPTNQNNFPIRKQPLPAVNLLKTWFQEKTPTKSKDLWSKSGKYLLTSSNIWPERQKPPSNTQELWLKSARTGYPFYPYTYPSYYQSKPYLDYYSFYLPPLLRPRPHYYISKPALTLKGNSMDDTYTFPPKRHYHSWVQPRLRKPPIAFQRKSYYSGYNLPVYSRTLQPVSIPKQSKPPPSYPLRMINPQEKQLYYAASAEQADSNNRDDMEKYIEQILMKRPH
ncbi:neurosecretory protein VGF [Parambassis ranga]|uniref:Neurosecretory protein VGF n=1 Tax=Parambassis ranga TaxID=210632 RepID=A0A6P7KCM3_9TELE|nr:neurosecretory protein VGF-like [Parambassis ranga]